MTTCYLPLPLLIHLIVTCGAVSGRDDWHHHHRLDFRPHVDLVNSSRDDEIMLTNLLGRPTSNQQVYHNRLHPLHVGTYPSRLFSFDDGDFNRRCLRCPADVQIVAKRRSLTAAFAPPQPHAFSSFCPEVTKENVVVHINSGPVPQQQLGPGLYPVFLTLIHYGKALPHKATQCNYTYEVIVNACLPLIVEDAKVSVVCSHENAWGSNCTFSCPSGYKREGFARTRCKNDLTWSREVPKCRMKKKGSCKLTGFQGVFECNNGEDLEPNEYVSSGTVCKLLCVKGSHIPRRQRHLAYIRCSRGRWNTTADPLCVPTLTLPSPTPKVLKVNKPRYTYIRRRDRRKMSMRQ